MARRRLSPEERAAWHQLARSVRPLTASARAPEGEDETQDAAAARNVALAPKSENCLMKSMTVPEQSASRSGPVDVLDSSWERSIKQGRLQPEMTIDLHGNSLVTAHQRLDWALGDAVADGVRVLLVITGKSREKAGSRDRSGRGAIRAEIADWLDRSPFAAHIASIRNAHPRHGGAGALYVIMRRQKVVMRRQI
jgi:DNA-nicking Smr family endonuclease